VDVLDDDDQRTRAARELDQMDKCPGSPALARGIVHGFVERAGLGALRQIEKVEQVGPLARQTGSDGERAFERCVPGGGVGTGRKLDERCRQLANRVAAFGHSEIEHEAGMAPESIGARAPPQFVDEPRLSDPGVSAQEDRAPRACLRTALERCRKLRELGPTSDKRLRAVPSDRSRQLHEPPCPHRRVDALGVRALDRNAPGDSLRAAVHGVVEHGFSGTRELQQAGREVHRMPDDRVGPVPRASQPAGDDLPRSDPDVAASGGRARCPARYGG
jgi:hypothetical protein